MKTYQSPGITTTIFKKFSDYHKILLPLIIIIISLPVYSQELAVVKSAFQNNTTVLSWNEVLKNTEGGASNWMALINTNNSTNKNAVEKSNDFVFTSFKVCLDNRKAVVNWSSFQDLNTDYYVIERSVNGQPFKEVAKIFTSPDSSAKFDYQYHDKLGNDIKGNIYFRLKIVDTNEQAVYSMVQLASSNKSYENLLMASKN
jgi:hypothetical protein